MKGRGKVFQQYKQIKFRARKKFLGKSLKREPCRCCFFGPVSSKEKPQAGLCLYQEMVEAPDWDTTLCDLEQARSCPKFCPAETSEVLKQRFARFISHAEESGDSRAMGAVAYHYPDVAALLWVLELWRETEEVEDPSEGSETLGPDEVEDEQPEEPAKPPREVTADSESDTSLGSGEETDSEEEEGGSPEGVVAPDTVTEDEDPGVETSAEELRKAMSSGYGLKAMLSRLATVPGFSFIFIVCMVLLSAFIVMALGFVLGD